MKPLATASVKVFETFEVLDLVNTSPTATIFVLVGAKILRFSAKVLVIPLSKVEFVPFD